MDEVFQYIIKNGWIIDRNHKLWVMQSKIVRMLRGDFAMCGKYRDYFNRNKHRLPESEDGEWVKRYNYKKCYRCDKTPLYNFVQYNWSISCKDHRRLGMISVRGKQKSTSPDESLRECKKIVERIVTRGWIVDPGHRLWRKQLGLINFLNGKTKKHTVVSNYYEKNKHRLPQNEDLELLKNYNRNCNLCDTRANFNFPRYKFAVRCKKHRREGMVDVIKSYCAHEGCTRSARKSSGRCKYHSLPTKKRKRNSSSHSNKRIKINAKDK
jgi:hypothetical protein